MNERNIRSLYSQYLVASLSHRFNIVTASMYSVLLKILHTYEASKVGTLDMNRDTLSIYSIIISSYLIKPNKSSFPFPPQVHPCGRYRHNTVVFLLAKEQGLKNLRTIHRLDRKELWKIIIFLKDQDQLERS